MFKLIRRVGIDLHSIDMNLVAKIHAILVYFLRQVRRHFLKHDYCHEYIYFFPIRAMCLMETFIVRHDVSPIHTYDTSDVALTRKNMGVIISESRRSDVNIFFPRVILRNAVRSTQSDGDLNNFLCFFKPIVYTVF